MTQAELVALVRSLIAGGESYYVEFKSAFENTPDGRKARDLRSVARDIGEELVAFANADGGDLLVGVEDDGAITGLPWMDDEKLGYLVQAPSSQVLDDPLAARVFRVPIDGRVVLFFRVEQHDGPPVVTASGRCLRRRRDRAEPISPAEIERLRQQRRGELAYEVEPEPRARIEDLDLSPLLDPARGWTAAAPPLLARSDDPLPLLRYWNLVEQRNGAVVLRRAALLLFAREPLRWHPNHRIRVRFVVGESVGWGRDLNTREVELIGPIPGLLRDAEALLLSSLARSTRVGSLFATGPLLPPEAVRECLVNAVVHRNYAVHGAAIELLFLPEQLEVRSPGGLPDAIQLDDLRAGKGVHRSRNPTIMRVLRDLGWTRDEGEGMRRIFDAMRQVELHVPDLAVEADTFIVRLSTRSVYDEATRDWLSAYGPALRPEARRYLLALRRAGGARSVDKLARALGLPFDVVRSALAELDQQGFVWRAPRSRSYHLVEPTNVVREQSLRAFLEAGLPIGSDQVLDLDTLMRLPRGRSPKAALEFADVMKSAEILVPAGSKRWRFGPTFLQYAASRGALTPSDASS